MACPYVSGLAAMVMAMDPNLSPVEVKKLIEDNVQKKPQYKNFVTTSGLIDVDKTLRAVAGNGATSSTSKTSTSTSKTTTTPASPTTCKTSPGEEDWIGDGFCDDEYNNQQCNWDGGDCCQDDDPLEECRDPNSPNYSGSSTPSTTTKAPNTCNILPGEEDWIGDNICDDQYNNKQCNWDAGDCCKGLLANCLDPDYIDNNHLAFPFNPNKF